MLSNNYLEKCSLQIGELGSGVYNLSVSGFGGMSFQNTTRLEYEGKSYSVFIETDRGVYKPADTIKFRAIVVNPYLKPSVTGAIDIFVAVSLIGSQINITVPQSLKREYHVCTTIS